MVTPTRVTPRVARLMVTENTPLQTALGTRAIGLMAIAPVRAYIDGLEYLPTREIFSTMTFTDTQGLSMMMVAGTRVSTKTTSKWENARSILAKATGPALPLRAR